MMDFVKIAKRFVLTVLVLFLLAIPPVAQTTTIQYVATDLADTTLGQDLWRYDYTVSGAFLQSWFFDIYFDANLYATLTNAATPSPDWDVLILQQPNPINIPPFDRGIFDAFALVNNPSLSGAFSVNFIYLGSGNPGSQPFDVFDADSNLVETGFTTVGGQEIPEPSTVALVVSGIGAIAILSRRKFQNRR